MRHHNANRKLSLTANARYALLRSLARSLVIHNSIETTEAKAKELRPFVERLITRSRVGTLAARRHVISVVGDEAGKKLIEDLGKRFAKHSGGYTRVLKTGVGKDGGADMARISFVA